MVYLAVVGACLMVLCFVYAITTENAETARKQEERVSKLAESDDLTSTDKILLEVLESTNQSAFVLKRFLFVAQCFAALWILDKVFVFFS